MIKILELADISKNFGGVKAVQNISLVLPKGKIVSIIGPNGAGKTTVFNLVSGIYTLDEGKVFLEGQEIDGLPQHHITRLGIARTFQNIRLFKGLSVMENVMTAMDPAATYTLAGTFFLTPGMRRQEKEIKQKAHHFLSIVGIDHLCNENPENLPYGYQRKLEIARAMATGPKVLLLDEPAAGLNPSEVSDFIDLMYRLHSDHSLSVLLIEHRMQVVMEMSDWVYVMNFGKQLAQGKPEEIQRNPEVIKAYIGEEN
jgi:branched-chain amino acid transport system ATP-binding protein